MHKTYIPQQIVTETDCENCFNRNRIGTSSDLCPTTEEWESSLPIAKKVRPFNNPLDDDDDDQVSFDCVESFHSLNHNVGPIDQS